jgi:hypothetical protein
MSDEDLIGYLFNLLDPADRAAVTACVESDPEVAARLAQLRADAAPMLAVAEVEREESPQPPPGLALRTIATVAQHVAEHEPSQPDPSAPSAVTAFLREFTAEPPSEFAFGSGTRAKKPQTAPAAEDATDAPLRMAPATDRPEFRSGFRFRADVLVAACIAFVGIGLVLSGVAKARHQSRIVACQNSLRTLHSGLAGFADNDPQGRYPQIGTPTIPTADAFATSLANLGYLPAGYTPGCPAGAECKAYTYTLGFRTPNNDVVGLRRPTPADPGEENDLMPISADQPTARVAPAGGPVSPHSGCMNVLFVGGNVRVTRSPNIGPRGDDIYRNVFGQVAAGANRVDAVLGGPGTRP